MKSGQRPCCKNSETDVPREVQSGGLRATAWKEVSVNRVRIACQAQMT
jgi:hypothetical protein